MYKKVQLPFQCQCQCSLYTCYGASRRFLHVGPSRGSVVGALQDYSTGATLDNHDLYKLKLTLTLPTLRNLIKYRYFL
jgi:hypothetical protein